VDTVRGVEYVYTKIFAAVCFEGVCLKKFQAEVGSIDYGMNIDGYFEYLTLSGTYNLL
jgi:hypothetical protein